jgi:plastocyanin
VTVTEVEYKLTLSPSKLAPGKTTLVVVNKGKLAHSLSISGPGLKKRLIAGTIKPGVSRSVTVTLKAGSYTLWCPVPGHAALGMKKTVKVGSTTTTSGALPPRAPGARPSPSATAASARPWVPSGSLLPGRPRHSPCANLPRPVAPTRRETM